MVIDKNLAKDLGRILFWYPLRGLVCALPLPFAYRLGGLLGLVHNALTRPAARQAMRATLSRALAVAPEMAGRLLIRNHQNHLRNTLELLKYPALVRRNNADTISRMEGLGELQAALAEGRGVLVATAHYGAKQLLQVALPAAGFTVCQLNYHAPPERLTYVQRAVAQRLRRGIESSLRVTFIPARGHLRRAVECLQQGHVLIVAGDGSGVEEHRTASDRTFPFLGGSLRVPTGIASLAERMHAPVVPAFVVREGWRHRILLGPILRSGQGRDLLADYIALLERRVRERPDLWEFWEEFERAQQSEKPVPAR